jgi:guanine deaminase
MILVGRLFDDPDQLPPPGWLRIERDRIIEVGEGPPPEPPAAGDENALICPGFIDAHLHLPQIRSIGCDGMDLLTWLDHVIYPAEIRWSNPDVAAVDVELALRSLLRSGTLGCAAFLTSHPGSVEVVRRSHASMPIRMIAGQALMDRNAPGGLIDQPVAPIPAATDRLAFSVNPRYAVACSETLLADAKRIAADSGTFVQTHLAEQRAECELVRKLFPHDPHYTDIYDRFGLLTDRTLVAHGVHLNEDEWRLLAERRSVVVHCPAANTFLGSGLFDLAAARRHGVRLALGSDIAAGPDLAMPRVARAMIEVAKLRRMTIDPDAHVPTPAEAWRMITEGNAEALGFDDAGRLEVGAAADLLVLRPELPVDAYLAGRLIYGWSETLITHRIVAGRVLDPSPPMRAAPPPGP